MRLAGGLWLCLLSWPAGAQPAGEIHIQFEKYSLKNGLSVILHHDQRLPLVAVSVWYDVGALHERPGRSGFAHLFEHMMFQGSLHVPEDKHFAFLQEAGGTGMNGTTDFDRTNYFETVPKNELDLALWLESDRMGFLLPALTDKSLKNQIEVVKNERRQSVENAPYGLMHELITQTIYPKSHPYYGDVIGSMEDLSKASLGDVKDFFQSYYTPANATLAIAGDFDPSTIKAQVEKYFGPLSGRKKPSPRVVAAPKIPKEKLIQFTEPVASLAQVSMVWMGPPLFSQDAAAMDLLAHVLSGTRSARLDAQLVHRDQIAQTVSAGFSEHRSGSQFRIELVVRPDHTAKEAHQAIDQVLLALKKNPSTEAERSRALNAQETRMIRGLEMLGGFGGRAEQLQSYNLFLGDPGKIVWDRQRYRTVTNADLARVVERYLNSSRLIVHATPAKKEVAK